MICFENPATDFSFMIAQAISKRFNSSEKVVYRVSSALGSFSIALIDAITRCQPARKASLKLTSMATEAFLSLLRTATTAMYTDAAATTSDAAATTSDQNAIQSDVCKGFYFWLGVEPDWLVPAAPD